MGLIGLIVGGIMDANKAIKQNNAQNNDAVENVVVDGRYSIDVPTFLSPTKKLSEDATLQYWNKTLDVALMVIDEPKSEFLDALQDMRETNPDFGKDDTLLGNMATVTLNNMFDMDNTEIWEYKETTINGLNAVTLNAFQKRTFFKDAVYASFAFIEGRDTLYQIIIQSGGTSIKKLSEKLERTIYSFKELVNNFDTPKTPVKEIHAAPEPEVIVEETKHEPEPNGTETPMVKYCFNCGIQLPVKARFCANCGKQQPN